MKYLVDTCVISELNRPRPDRRVYEWFDSQEETALYTSVLVFGEIMKGICEVSDRGKKKELLKWLRGLHDLFGRRALPVDTDVAQQWGEIDSHARRKGSVIPAIDGLLAATAVYHGLHLVTRNAKDFAFTGVSIFNPWTDPERGDS